MTIIITLTQKNGQVDQFEYKRLKHLKLDEDLIYRICCRLAIQYPTYNELSKEFEFEDNSYMGKDKMKAPKTLEITDDQGWPLEFEDDKEVEAN
jgi:hypothetical protein